MLENATLKAAETPFWHEPRDIHGGYVFYCTAPGNILVEVGCRPLGKGAFALNPRRQRKGAPGPPDAPSYRNRSEDQ